MTTKHWPALDVDAADEARVDRVQTIADDFGPTAIEEIEVGLDGRLEGAGLRVFFATNADRDRAASVLQTEFRVFPVDVPDDDWARRCQEHLTPITVGRIRIAPPWHVEPEPPITIVIVPSMGFGTGHHATTRLCLAALQAIDVTGAFVLDVGTGSGVLAIAALRLGAARALGIDDDPDAIQSANENVALNPLRHPGQTVTCMVGDLMTMELPRADVATANLTGALLIRAAGRLRQAVRAGGVLIVSGLLMDERDDVRGAFAGDEIIGDANEDGWTTFTVRIGSNG